MTPLTTHDSPSHLGLIKVALKSWLVSTSSFLPSNPLLRWSRRSKLAWRCTYPSPHSTNTIQHPHMSHSCSKERLYGMLPMQTWLYIHQSQLLVPQLFAFPQSPFHQLHHQDRFFHPNFIIIPSQSSPQDFLHCSLGRLLSAYLREMR